jgi:hypothetical protein
MSGICKDFSESAAYVEKWLKSQQGVKEESLTDWLLYDIDVRRPDVIYKAFTRQEEARDTGADWEWWLIFPDGAVRLRVQAKKLKAANDNYPGLAHTNKYGLQIDKLIADASKVNAFPIYAFYSAKSPSSKCSFGGVVSCGVHLAGAKVVEQTLLSKKCHVSEADAIALSVPLPCLVCCPLTHGVASKSGFTEFLRRYFVSDQGDEPESYMPGHYDTLPPFISSLLGQDGDIPDWWESEFQGEIAGIKAIVVTDLRANNSFKPMPLRGTA